MIPIKTSQEIEKMRASCKLASAILDQLSAMLCPGITTKDVDQSGAKLMAEAGCKSAFLGYRRFPGHICISVNDEVVHGIGGSRRIQYGDVVKLDIGVVLNGFVGDTAATIPVGLVSGDVQRLLTVTEEALSKGIENVRDGRRLNEVCPPSRTRWSRTDSVWSRNLSAMASVATFMKNLRSRIIEAPGRRQN